MALTSSEAWVSALVSGGTGALSGFSGDITGGVYQTSLTLLSKCLKSQTRLNLVCYYGDMIFS